MRRVRCGVLLLLLATMSCRGSCRPAWQRTQALGRLPTEIAVTVEPPSEEAAALAGDVHRVLVQPKRLGQQRVTVTEPGAREFFVPSSTELGVDIQSGEAQLRDERGGSTSRPAKLQYKGRTLRAVVDFTDADVGVPLDMTVTANLPWPPLRAETQDFVVPSGARLRFSVAMKVPDAPFVPARVHFRVSLSSRAGEPVPVVYESDLERPENNVDVGWSDVETDLSAYGGQSVRLIFEATRSAAIDNSRVTLPLPLISEPFLVTELPRAQHRNVVLVSIDTLRADHVGAYGYSRPTSPLIDHLAAGGTTFDSAFAHWPETSVSHMTLFTSLYPAVHGVSITRWGGRGLPAWQTTLAEVLSQHGYVTGGITEDGLLAYFAGFSRGFSTYREFQKPRTFVSAAAVAERVFGAGAQWLRSHRDDAFFLFLHTYQVHERIAPGAAYDQLRAQFEHDGVPAVNEKGAVMMRQYDAAIRYTDDALATIVRTLEELRLTDRTLLIVTSDHGEEFGTHNAYGHGGTLFDGAVRVPLVLWSPGFIPAGKRSETQVGLIDLMPTLLELLGVPPVAQAQGHSFAPLLLRGAAPASQPLFFELGDNLRAVRYPDYKVIWKPGPNGGHADYYDLRRDPGETASENGAPERVEQAVTRLREHDLESVSHREQLAARAGTAPTVAAVPLDPQVVEQMRALGYDVQQP